MEYDSLTAEQKEYLKLKLNSRLSSDELRKLIPNFDQWEYLPDIMDILKRMRIDKEIAAYDSKKLRSDLLANLIPKSMVILEKALDGEEFTDNQIKIAL